MLHLKYFVANMIRKFHWKIIKEEEVDLDYEKPTVTIVVKNSLQAKIIPRKL